jgi:hypothetical protein
MQRCVQNCLQAHDVPKVGIGRTCWTERCPFRSRGTLLWRCLQQHVTLYSMLSRRYAPHAWLWCVQDPGSCLPAGKSSRLQPSGIAQGAS